MEKKGKIGPGRLQFYKGSRKVSLRRKYFRDMWHEDIEGGERVPDG